MDIFDDNNGRNLTLIEQYQSSDAVSQTRYVLGAFLFIIQETQNAVYF